MLHPPKRRLLRRESHESLPNCQHTTDFESSTSISTAASQIVAKFDATRATSFGSAVARIASRSLGSVSSSWKNCSTAVIHPKSSVTSIPRIYQLQLILASPDQCNPTVRPLSGRALLRGRTSEVSNAVQSSPPMRPSLLEQLLRENNAPQANYECNIPCAQNRRALNLITNTRANSTKIAIPAR